MKSLSIVSTITCLHQAIHANSRSRQRKFCFNVKVQKNKVGSKLKIEQIKGEQKHK